MSDPERDPDAELVAGVGRSDPAAVRTLVARKLPRLLALATRMLGDRMEAEDVAQEAFLRIWKHAPRWRAGEARFDTWLHRVVLNLCYDRLRSTRDEPVDTPPERVDPGPAPDARLDAHARDAGVRAALAALPTRQREAIVLQYYQELSNLEAAAVMGITVDALESLLSRARRNLRAQLAPPPAGLAEGTAAGPHALPPATQPAAPLAALPAASLLTASPPAASPLAASPPTASPPTVSPPTVSPLTASPPATAQPATRPATQPAAQAAPQPTPNTRTRTSDDT